MVLVPATCEDYRLLENMNKLTSLKYMEMKDISINISRNLQDLNNKCESYIKLASSSTEEWSAPLYRSPLFVFSDASLQPYLDQINQIEEQVSSLEQAAYKLDAYSKKLGEKHIHTRGKYLIVVLKSAVIKCKLNLNKMF